MRKQIIDTSLQRKAAIAQDWLDLESLASVQVTSEQASNPIELALTASQEPLDDSSPGWLAEQAGEQTIRLLFDKPQRLTLIGLYFQEAQQERTQEFLLRYSTDKGKSYQEIIRQQYTFSPPYTTTQKEAYSVQLEGVSILELFIIPDIRGGSARASLHALHLA
jgi:hypothetical protein